MKNEKPTDMCFERLPLEELEDDIQCDTPAATPPQRRPPQTVRAVCTALFRDYLNTQNIGIAVLIVTVAVLGYYILFPSRGFFHSDSTDTLMWATASYDAGALLNPDFEYACFLPFGGQLLMIPLIALFGVSMTTQVIGMLLFFLLFTAALLFMFRQMKWGWGGACFGTACVLLLLSGSEKLREIFWGHVIYYSLGMLYLFVGLGLVFKLTEMLKTPVGTKKLPIVFGALLAVWCVMAAANQLEILTLFSVPLLAALIAERFFDFSRSLTMREQHTSLALIGGIAVATMIGYGIGSLLCKDMFAAYASAYSSFCAPEEWLTNLDKFIPHWTSLFGVEMKDGAKIADLNGIKQLLLLITSLVLLIAPVIATVLYPKIKDRPFRILLLSHWFMTALVMMGFIVGRLSAANWRLSPILCTSAIVTMSLVRWCWVHRPTFRRLTLLAVIPILITCVFTVSSIAAMSPSINQDASLYVVAQTLRDKGLTYGYSTFWKANALTVIADSDVKCRNITLTPDNQSYEKGLYQSESAWFEDQEGVEQYFVLLDEGEYNNAVNAANPLITAAVDAFRIDTPAGDTVGKQVYYVLVHSGNIF